MSEQALPDPSSAALREQFDDAEQQEAAATLGIWVFLATEVLFFGALFASYTITRLRLAEAFAAASRETDLFWGTFETGVLLTSSLTMALAVRAARLERRTQVTDWLRATALLGVAFVGIHIYEYRHDFLTGLVPGFGFTFEPAHLAPQAEAFFFLYYGMTLLHLLHVSLGVVVLAVVAHANRLGRFSARYYTPVEVTGLYWHFVDVVWIFLYPLFYLISRAQ